MVLQKIVQILVLLRKAKTLYVNMLKSLFLYSISLGFGEKLVKNNGCKNTNLFVLVFAVLQKRQQLATFVGKRIFLPGMAQIVGECRSDDGIR